MTSGRINIEVARFTLFWWSCKFDRAIKGELTVSSILVTIMLKWYHFYFNFNVSSWWENETAFTLTLNWARVKVRLLAWKSLCFQAEAVGWVNWTQNDINKDFPRIWGKSSNKWGKMGQHIIWGEPLQGKVWKEIWGEMQQVHLFHSEKCFCTHSGKTFCEYEMSGNWKGCYKTDVRSLTALLQFLKSNSPIYFTFTFNSKVHSQ